MNCPEDYRKCGNYKESESIECQCQTDSSVGYCVKKVEKDKGGKWWSGCLEED